MAVTFIACVTVYAGREQAEARYHPAGDDFASVAIRSVSEDLLVGSDWAAAMLAAHQTSEASQVWQAGEPNLLNQLICQGELRTQQEPIVEVAWLEVVEFLASR